jgi:hypothetical protein
LTRIGRSQPMKAFMSACCSASVNGLMMSPISFLAGQDS